MAGAISVTGLTEMLFAKAKLPEAVRAELRAEARAVAGTIRDEAQRDVPKSPNPEHHVAITIHEDPSRQQVIVEAVAIGNGRWRGKSVPTPRNLPLWLEKGTVKMAPRPYMAPAAARANATYITRMDAALQRACDGTFGR